MIIGLGQSGMTMAGCAYVVRQGHVFENGPDFWDWTFCNPLDKTRTATRVGLFMHISDLELHRELIANTDVEFRCEVTDRTVAAVGAAILLDEETSAAIPEVDTAGICRSVAIEEHEFRPGWSFTIKLRTNEGAISACAHKAIHENGDFVCIIRPFVVLRAGGAEVPALFAAVSAAGCVGCIHHSEKGCQRQPEPHPACVRKPEGGPYR